MKQSFYPPAKTLIFLIFISFLGALALTVIKSSALSGSRKKEFSCFGQAGLQYALTLRQSAVRLILAGTEPRALLFTRPADFAALTAEQQTRALFHPEGVHTPYETAPPEIMKNNPTTWSINAEFQIAGVGLDSTENSNGNEIIAFLPGLTTEACLQIHKKYDLPPPLRYPHIAPAAFARHMDHNYIFPATPGIVINPQASTTFGCLQDANGTNIYYHVLIER